MFLAPVRVLEVSPPRPRKKERRIASHRVSPPTSACSSSPPFLPPRRLASSYVVYRGWNRRENINFSVPRLTYASFPPLLLLLFVLLLLQHPSRPWDFLGHGSVIWCSTDVPSFLLLLQPRSIARIFGHGAFRAFGPGTRREQLPFFSPGTPSVPRCRSRGCDFAAISTAVTSMIINNI